jgi:hypothetical protein
MSASNAISTRPGIASCARLPGRATPIKSFPNAAHIRPFKFKHRMSQGFIPAIKHHDLYRSTDFICRVSLRHTLRRMVRRCMQYDRNDIHSRRDSWVVLACVIAATATVVGIPIWITGRAIGL